MVAVRSRTGVGRADPVLAYHELLERGGVREASAEALREGQNERSLVFGEHPLCVSLRPRLVSRQTYEAATRASESVVSALRRLERALLADADLRGELDLDAEEERLALADPGFRQSSPAARIDGFFSDELRFVEYNAESPAGQAYSDELTDVFETLPVMRAFRRAFRVRRLPVAARQIAVMLRAFRQWGRGDRPRVAIVDWTGVPTVSEFEMFRARLESKGVSTVICDPSALEYSRGTLRAGGDSVNLVYRRVLSSELLAAEDSGHALTTAYLDGAVCVVNSFRSKLLHKKMSLTLLSDQRYGFLYTAEQRRAIARHIPWTRKVREGSTTMNDGSDVPDLMEFIVANRERLVLKPNDEYGGKGVVLGWTVDDAEWEQALAVAVTQSYVVQEAVEIPREPYPVAIEGVDRLDLAVDMDPYLFDGRVSGCLTRLSSSALLNVTAGEGSVVPTYVVEGPR